MSRRFSIESITLAKNLFSLAVEKKAREPRLLEVMRLTSYTDYILILTATSDRHARALTGHMSEQMKKLKVKPIGIEGQDTGQWVLLDYGDVVVHIFQETFREYYDLDGLWIDAEQLACEEAV